MNTLCELQQNLTENNQSHLLTFWDELNEKERQEFTSQLSSFDIPRFNEAFKNSKTPELPNSEDIKQIEPERCVDRENLSSEELEHLRYLAIADGKVAVVVMAGGQATRLGADKPKGVLKMGTNLSEKTDSLLFMQACQIVSLLKLAKEKYPESNPSILWLIMTSESTNAETKAHIDVVTEEVGFPKDSVFYFVQKQVPCFDFNGKVFLSEKNEISTSPDGNGGIYKTIESLLPFLETRKVNYLHVYCVDNILCRVADPVFIGSVIDKEADAAAKVIEKKNPEEAVGHVCIVGQCVKVIEYSEIPKELMNLRDSSGKLFLRAGNIANHIFTLDFLKKVCANADDLRYHIARKKIPHIDLETGQHINPSEPNGFKLELFIFDAFCYSQNFLMYQVPVGEEFSPLKNPDSVGRDCFTTCLKSFYSDQTKWLRDSIKNALSN